MYPIAVLASGRGSNLKAIIDAQKNGELKGNVSVVISDNPQAKALTIAEGNQIPYHIVEPKSFSSKQKFNQALIKILKDYSVKLIVLAGYMRLLAPEVISAFPNQIINIHPSLLPAFPGLEAQKQAFDYGVRYTGCTVHFVDQGMDTGAIIAQRVVPIHPEDNPDDLTKKILKEEHSLYPQVINWFAKGRVRLEGRKVFIQGEDI